MIIYIAGNTGTIAREKALCNLGMSRLLSFYYVTTQDFGADRAFYYALDLKGHPNPYPLELLDSRTELFKSTHEQKGDQS